MGRETEEKVERQGLQSDTRSLQVGNVGTLDSSSGLFGHMMKGDAKKYAGQQGDSSGQVADAPSAPGLTPQENERYNQLSDMAEKLAAQCPKAKELQTKLQEDFKKGNYDDCRKDMKSYYEELEKKFPDKKKELEELRKLDEKVLETMIKLEQKRSA